MWPLSYWLSALGACSSPTRASFMPSREAVRDASADARSAAGDESNLPFQV